MNRKQPAEVTFSNNRPIPWRIIDAGLCLEGRCLATNGRCHAYKQMVIGNLGLGEFTISEMYTFECPQCKGYVRAEKFGLNRCQWRIMNSHKWSIVNNVYRTYDLSSSPIHLEVHQLEEHHDSIENCTICLAAMDKKSKCSILRCKHLFHMDCIHNWIDADEDTSLQCPICRQPIFE